MLRQHSVLESGGKRHIFDELQQRRPISTKDMLAKRSRLRYAVTPSHEDKTANNEHSNYAQFTLLEEGVTSQPLSNVPTRGLAKEVHNSQVPQSSNPLSYEMMPSSNQVQVVLNNGELIAQLGGSHQNGDHTHFFGSNVTLTPSRPISSKENLNKVQQHLRSLTFNPMRKTDSVTVRKIKSTNRIEEFSVAEMSAQVMLDQHDKNSDKSEQPSGIHQSLSNPTGMFSSNFMSIEKMQNEPQTNTLSVEDGSINIDLEIVIKEAIKEIEEKKNQVGNVEVNRVSLLDYLLANQGHIREQHAPRRYMEKKLPADPQLSRKQLRRQDEKVIHMKHIHNDRQHHLRQHDFQVQGKKLTKIKQNYLHHQIYAYLQYQIEQLHIQQSSDRSAQLRNATSNELADGLQRYIEYMNNPLNQLQTPSTHNQGGDPNSQLRRPVPVYQTSSTLGASDNPNVKQIYSSVANQHHQKELRPGLGSPNSRGLDSVHDRKKGSELTTGQPTLNAIQTVYNHMQRGLPKSAGSGDHRFSDEVSKQVSPAHGQMMATLTGHAEGHSGNRFLRVREFENTRDGEPNRPGSSGVVSLSAYGGGVSSMPGENIISSPRMQFLQAYGPLIGFDP